MPDPESKSGSEPLKWEDVVVLGRVLRGALLKMFAPLTDSNRSSTPMPLPIQFPLPKLNASSPTLSEKEKNPSSSLSSQSTEFASSPTLKESEHHISLMLGLKIFGHEYQVQQHVDRLIRLLEVNGFKVEDHEWV